MPTYSYRCSNCGHQFEKVQRITEDALKTCPSCGLDTAARQIQNGNFILKGGGWYGDLYSGGSNKKASASSSDSGSSGGSTSTVSSGTSCEGGACAAPSTAAPSAPATSTASSSGGGSTVN